MDIATDAHVRKEDTRVRKILGILENLSFFKCLHCGEPWHIFGKGGARRTADEMGLSFLGEVPLEADIRKCSDEGVPVVLSNPDSAVSKAYSDVAQKVVSRLQELYEQQFLRPEINL
ncbi:similar to INDH1 [Actinidia rufa]|uniref:Similar to INDH1 n=1 Tax=Actinidia rufa TaxID=165716 RepID=A0A7J0H9H2_9ERIC|nr:similar to INDH1 [Actinidia rufa]